MKRPQARNPGLHRIRASSAPDRCRLQETQAGPKPGGDNRFSLRLGRIYIDILRRRVFVAGRPIRVGPRRFDLLCVLVHYPRGKTKEELLDFLWGVSSGPKTVDMSVFRLRKDLSFMGEDVIQYASGRYKLNRDRLCAG